MLKTDDVTSIISAANIVTLLCLTMATAFAPLAAGDTPVHCLRQQMYGEWFISMSAPQQIDHSRALSEPPNCTGEALQIGAT